MSLSYRVSEQVLRLGDVGEPARNVAAKYDAFLNLLCSGPYGYQKEAVMRVVEFLASVNYQTTEKLALENYNARPEIQKRYDNKAAFLDFIPLRDLKAVSLDLATGTGKSYVIYALAAIALAEGLVDRVLVLCPSLTIEGGLREKFGALILNQELTQIMKELGAAVATPGLKKANDTVDVGDICVENIHAAYERTGTSIADSFNGRGGRTLVINDEAHHIFSEADAATKKWLEFLQKPEFDFRYVVNLTGTPYVGNDYFPDVLYRYGLKQAIEDKVVKRPNYKEEETLKEHSWDVTRAIHEQNKKDYGHAVKPISIVVSADIARCVEVWRELVNYLVKKDKISKEEAEKRCIWVTSGIPTGKGKERIVKACPPRFDKDSPERRRKENIEELKKVDDRECPVEWIVSVSMLTEGWDVKNVFQIVPHESRAFNSKLLIAQVLGRGLRVPKGLGKPALVTVNNHEKWSGEIQNLLKEVLEIDSVLGWEFVEDRKRYAFPLHNLEYKAVQTTTQKTKKPAKVPSFTPRPQSQITGELAKFSETGTLKVLVEHTDNVSIEVAVKQLKIFLNEKDEALAKEWTKKRITKFVVDALNASGYESIFLSRENLTLLQQGFGPMLPEKGEEYPRLSQKPDNLFKIDLSKVSHQTIAESSLRSNGGIFYVNEDATKGFTREEINLWEPNWRKRSTATAPRPGRRRAPSSARAWRNTSCDGSASGPRRPHGSWARTCLAPTAHRPGKAMFPDASRR